MGAKIALNGELWIENVEEQARTNFA